MIVIDVLEYVYTILNNFFLILSFIIVILNCSHMKFLFYLFLVNLYIHLNILISTMLTFATQLNWLILQSTAWSTYNYQKIFFKSKGYNIHIKLPMHCSTLPFCSYSTSNIFISLCWIIDLIYLKHLLVETFYASILININQNNIITCTMKVYFLYA